MAIGSAVSRITISGTTGSRSWVGTAAVQDTAAGGSVVITFTMSSSGALPPLPPDGFRIYIRDTDGGGATVYTIGLDTTAASQTVTFYFTTDGTSGGGTKAGLLEMMMEVNNTTGGIAGTYQVRSDLGYNTPPATFTTTVADRGYIIGTTTVVLSVSNVSLGGAVPAFFSYGEVVYQRAVYGHTLYAAKQPILTYGVKSGAAVNSAGPNHDRTHTGIVDNAFPNTSTSYTPSIVSDNSNWAGVPYTSFTTTTATAVSADPRITLPLRAQKDPAGSLGASADSTSFSIGADVGFMWVASSASSGAVNAAGVKLAGLTIKQDLIAADAVTVVVTGTSVTDANGVTSRLDFTSGILPPAANRTQKATITAPANATGTSSRTIGFASPYTGDRSWLIVVSDYLTANIANPIKARYVSTTGVVAPDSAPTCRVYTIDSAGVDTVVLTGTMTLIGNNTYQIAWTPTTVGVYAIEVSGIVNQSAVEGTAHVTVRQLFFDGAGFVGFPTH